jgi:redox-sensing transcriptional repressor
VPSQSAQATADIMTEAGIKGILNFAPVPLKLPEGVYADRMDITMTLEKIAYLAKQDENLKV